MGTVALIVGIDAYRDQPLTSAVHDALAFRDAIVDLGLADPGSITVLTAPVGSGDPEATRDQITAELRRLYVSGDDLDRMYVYFSGHGMQIPVGGAHSMSSTAFLPADVSDPVAEPWKLLNIDSLLQSFRTAGPREQFFFVDACRDLAYDQYPPDLPPIGLGGRNQPPVGARAQAVLYAVSPGGQALGRRDGLGVMSGHLIRALYGDGEALDYDEALDSYVVTMHSVYAYVRARIEEDVRVLPGWQRQYMLPDPMSAGPPLDAIRLVPQPPPASLTLTVDPPDDEQWVMVNLLQRGTRLAEPHWPPAIFGEAIPVPPQRFRLQVASYHGATGVEPELIDARTTSAALIRHRYMGPLGPGPALPPQPIAAPGDPGPGPSLVTYSEDPIHPLTRDLIRVGEALKNPSGTLATVAVEPWATVRVAGLQPPYREWRQPAGSELFLPPGPYRVQFRIGSQIFSDTEAEVEDDHITTVLATAAASQLVARVTGEALHPSSVRLSDQLGPVQANPALSMMSLISLGSYQPPGVFAAPRVFPALPQSGGPTISLAVAVDGNRWPVPAADVAASIRAESRAAAEPWQLVRLEPASDWPGAENGHRSGLSQIVTGAATAGPAGGTLAIRSPHTGNIELAVASVPGRLTSVAIVFRADGGIDVAQFLAETGSDTRSILARAQYALHGQWLYESGELADAGSDRGSSELRDILNGTTVDPILSVMAFHAWSDALSADSRGQIPLSQPDMGQLRDRVGHLLVEAFPSLPDAVVVAALLDAGHRDRLRELAADGPAPVLARTVRAGAALWPDPELPLARLARRLAPGHAWTLYWTPQDTEARQA